jgi:hypothetical protein
MAGVEGLMHGLRLSEAEMAGVKLRERSRGRTKGLSHKPLGN